MKDRVVHVGFGKIFYSRTAFWVQKNYYQRVIKVTHYPNQFYAGINAGAVSLNCVVINRDRNIIYEFPYQRHLGKVQKALQETLKTLYLKFGKDRFHSVSFTGTHGITFGKKLERRLPTQTCGYQLAIGICDLAMRFTTS